jgi:hypothetical protein
MLGTLSNRRGLKRAITPIKKLVFHRILTGTLECLDVLGAGGKLGYSLYKGHSGLLVGLEGGKDCTRHNEAIY